MESQHGTSGFWYGHDEIGSGSKNQPPFVMENELISGDTNIWECCICPI